MWFGLLLLVGCSLDPGDPCETTGDGFTRHDPCGYTCVEWEVSCADGSTAVPDVCSGESCTAGSCPVGFGCAKIDMTDYACLPQEVCPSGFAP